ncbi:MAG TPA: L,D-transpeptidase family protein [Syntrophorhabdaceae bacterium]|nr:L,D-transpeptidase family protein [Syntrophorhabdaceae bacterium]
MAASLFAVLALVLIAFCLFNTSNNSKTNYTYKNQSGTFIVIYIEEKKLYLFKDNVCIKVYPIASGKRESPSPVGQWKIVEKMDWGEGFGGCWLGLNVTWGKYGIHGTTKEDTIGFAASHGCIRMLNKDVRDLYGIVSIGTPVNIKNGPYGAFGTGFRKLIPGDRGADVLAVQLRLKELGYYKGWESGIYEYELQAALNQFQKNKGLKVKYTITKDDYLAMGFTEME